MISEPDSATLLLTAICACTFSSSIKCVVKFSFVRRCKLSSTKYFVCFIFRGLFLIQKYGRSDTAPLPSILLAAGQDKPYHTWEKMVGIIIRFWETAHLPLP